MILILSQSENESSTEDVMDWLTHWGAPCYRLNGDDLDAGGRLDLAFDADGGRLNGLGFSLDQARVVWFRRWVLARSFMRAPLLQVDAAARQGSRDPARVLEQQLGSELDVLSGYLFSRLRKKRVLGRPPGARLNKLAVLETAAACGLVVPATLVADNKASLAEFRARCEGGVITKPLGEATFYDFPDGSWCTYTASVDEALIHDLPDPFFPSLFQEMINKRYELRVFFLRRRIWSMAIFSQTNALTEVDFRRYDHERPNRTVPYQLPDDVTDKLTRLMDELGLDTGSIDLIRDTAGRYVFLEVNPAGQFGMVSRPCNYFLEREVAATLAAEHEHA